MTEYKYKVVNVDDSSYFVQPGSSFFFRYGKGQRVKAPNGSLGIMVFDAEELAEKFISNPICRKIKRVIPIGKATVPLQVSRWPDSAKLLNEFNMLTLEQRQLDRGCIAPPKGTVCYPEVIVVD
jgi:hypothetical protein